MSLGGAGNSTRSQEGDYATQRIYCGTRQGAGSSPGRVCDGAEKQKRNRQDEVRRRVQVQLRRPCRLSCNGDSTAIEARDRILATSRHFPRWSARGHIPDARVGRVDGLGRHRNIRSGRAATVRGRVYLLPALRWLFVHRRSPGRGHRRAGQPESALRRQRQRRQRPPGPRQRLSRPNRPPNAQRPHQQPHSPRERC